MADTLIKVEHVSKKFCRSLKKSLWYGMQDLGNELIGHRYTGNGSLRDGEFWAVDDVSFELERGECLGLIGRNGAGKTTMLRLLNGLVKPDQGRIEVRGRVGALIALGAGFHPLLTGRENIYVNATVLGLPRSEIDAKLEQIIDFSGVGEFIDSPVQHYSSGMYVRLGFSIAAHLQPDVLLVDEALAVGDLAFTLKCLNRIAELRREGTAVIFVSHNELQVREAATRCIVMARGKLLGDGDLDHAFLLYNRSGGLGRFGDSSDAGFVHDGPIRMGHCTVEPASPAAEIATGSGLRITLHYASTTVVHKANLELRIWSAKEQLLTTLNTSTQDLQLEVVPGENVVLVDIPMLALVPGRYRLAGGITQDGSFLGWARDLTHFEVTPPHDVPIGGGLVFTPATFSVLPGND